MQKQYEKKHAFHFNVTYKDFLRAIVSICNQICASETWFWFYALRLINCMHFLTGAGYIDWIKLLVYIKPARSCTDYIWNFASATIIVSVRPSVHHNTHQHIVENSERGCTCRRFASLMRRVWLSLTWADLQWHLDTIWDSKTHASGCNAMTEHAHGADIIHAGSREVAHSVTHSLMQNLSYGIVN